MPKIQKIIDLDLSDVPRSKHKEVKELVSEFVLDEILGHVEDGISPVKNQQKFKRLTKEYADAQKNGNRSPDLELDGDLLDGTHVEPHRRGVRIFVDADESDKADGHNQLTSKAKAWAKKKKFPQRRFVPDKNQDLKPKIERGIDAIISKFEEEPETPQDEGGGESVTLDDVLSAENIIDEIRRQSG